MNHLEENHEDRLSLFIFHDSARQFGHTEQSMDIIPYMDIRRSTSTLRVKLQLLDVTGSPIGKETNVGLVNLSLHSFPKWTAASNRRP